MTTEEIQAAMLAEAQPHGLRVHAHHDLGGASVSGKRIEAYVYPRAAGGFTIDLWRHGASDAFQVSNIDDLTAAIALAVQSALGRQPSGKQR